MRLTILLSIIVGCSGSDKLSDAGELNPYITVICRADREKDCLDILNSYCVGRYDELDRYKMASIPETLHIRGKCRGE